MSKSIIIPLIAVVCIGVKLGTGIEIQADVQSAIVDAVTSIIAIGATVYGIFKNHKDETPKSDLDA